MNTEKTRGDGTRYSRTPSVLYAIGDLEGNVLTKRRYHDAFGIENFILLHNADSRATYILNADTGELMEKLKIVERDDIRIPGEYRYNRHTPRVVLDKESVYLSYGAKTWVLNKDGKLLKTLDVAVEQVVRGGYDVLIARDAKGNCGIMDMDYKWKIQPQYGKISLPDKNGNMQATRQGENTAILINQHGDLAVQQEYEGAELEIKKGALDYAKRRSYKDEMKAAQKSVEHNWDFSSMSWLFAMTEETDILDVSDLFVLTHNAREKQGLQAIVDSKGTVLKDNLKNIDFCDGYRLIGQRGFEWGMMDMQGNWIYSESIFGGLED
ncbi:DUF5046 domain-containing protein [Clostridia bacterium OttesenSCG-928-F22]|nr:DUF5046 domain-containing protein [Clostridia bacterium OttesenSCG-928-F22]